MSGFVREGNRLRAVSMDEHEQEEDLRAMTRVKEIEKNSTRLAKVRGMLEKQSKEIRRSLKDLKELGNNAGSIEPGVVDRHDLRIADEPLTSVDGDNPHRHTVDVSKEGNGKTIWTVGDKPHENVAHEHIVKGGKILENTDGSDPHTHRGDNAVY